MYSRTFMFGFDSSFKTMVIVTKFWICMRAVYKIILNKPNVNLLYILRYLQFSLIGLASLSPTEFQYHRPYILLVVTQKLIN